MHSLSLIHEVDHLVIEGRQVVEVVLAFDESVLNSLITWLSQHVLYDHTQDHPLHNLPQYIKDRLTGLWILDPPSHPAYK